MGLDLNTQADQLMDSWRKALDATRAAGKRMLAPAGFGFDDADMLIEPMDYMLLHNVASKMVAKHKGLAAAARAEK